MSAPTTETDSSGPRRARPGPRAWGDRGHQPEDGEAREADDARGDEGRARVGGDARPLHPQPRPGLGPHGLGDPPGEDEDDEGDDDVDGEGQPGRPGQDGDERGGDDRADPEPPMLATVATSGARPFHRSGPARGRRRCPWRRTPPPRAGDEPSEQRSHVAPASRKTTSLSSDSPRPASSSGRRPTASDHGPVTTRAARTPTAYIAKITVRVATSKPKSFCQNAYIGVGRVAPSMVSRNARVTTANEPPVTRGLVSSCGAPSVTAGRASCRCCRR